VLASPGTALFSPGTALFSWWHLCSYGIPTDSLIKHNFIIPHNKNTIRHFPHSPFLLIILPHRAQRFSLGGFSVHTAFPLTPSFNITSSFLIVFPHSPFLLIIITNPVLSVRTEPHPPVLFNLLQTQAPHSASRLPHSWHRLSSASVLAASSFVPPSWAEPASPETHRLWPCRHGASCLPPMPS